MKLYHFLESKWAIDNLQKKRIKVSEFSSLNDPFEFHSIKFIDQQSRLAWNRVKRRLSDKIGIICFSKSWKNPVQWSHYAEKHKGICLGFDIDDGDAAPVSYRNKRISVDVHRMRTEPAYGEAVIQKALITKFSHWSYEQETRVFFKLDELFKDNSMYFQNFDRKIRLTEIILGADCSCNAAQIEQIISNYQEKPKIKKARLSFREFKVITQLDRNLW